MFNQICTKNFFRLYSGKVQVYGGGGAWMKQMDASSGGMEEQEQTAHAQRGFAYEHVLILIAF